MKKRYAGLFIPCLVLFLAMTTPAVAKDPTVIVRQAYQDILGRQPDKEGLRTFRSKIIDQGWTERQVRDALRQSQEFKIRRSTIIVTRAYEDILNRKPDRAGLKFYQDHIIYDNWTEKQVRASLRQSQEYRNHHRNQGYRDHQR